MFDLAEMRRERIQKLLKLYKSQFNRLKDILKTRHRNFIKMKGMVINDMLQPAQLHKAERMFYYYYYIIILLLLLPLLLLLLLLLFTVIVIVFLFCFPFPGIFPITFRI